MHILAEININVPLMEKLYTWICNGLLHKKIYFSFLPTFLILKLWLPTQRRIFIFGSLGNF